MPIKLKKSTVNPIYYDVEGHGSKDRASVRIEVEHREARVRNEIEDAIVRQSNGRRDRSEKFGSDPVGYLVLHFTDDHGVWEIFEHLNDAQKCADKQAAEHKFWCKTEKEWEIFPLYPGQPMPTDAENRSKSIQ